MGARANKAFVGFGFGPIQSGLFLYEAYMSGNFSRFVVAEIDGDLVRAVADNGGSCAINIARGDRIDRAELAVRPARASRARGHRRSRRGIR